MGKTGGKYRDLFYDVYKEYLKKVMVEQKNNEGKKHNKDKTIETRATDTFFWKREKQSLF